MQLAAVKIPEIDIEDDPACRHTLGCRNIVIATSGVADTVSVWSRVIDIDSPFTYSCE